MTSKMRLRALIAGAAIAALGAGGAAFAANANAATIPLINVSVGMSTGGVAGYYGADDAHTHYRYVEAVITASPTLTNLNGLGANLGAAGVELCDENTGWAAQIGVYSTGGGHYGVAFADSAGLGGGVLLNNTLDDPCIDGGMVNPSITTAAHFNNSFNNVITTGDKLLVSVYYDPHGFFGNHRVTFAVTDLSKINEHRSINTTVPTQSLGEFGIGVLSDASNVTADLNNLVDTFGTTDVNFYSSKVNAYPIINQKAFYGYGGLSQVQFVNVSTQPEMSPNSTLTASGFSVFEGSTTP